MEWAIIGAGVLGVISLIVALVWMGRSIRLASQKVENYDPFARLAELPQPPAPQVNVNLKPMEEAIKQIPNKVLQSIQSSVNTKKGALGELIGYIELEAQYDRIIPLGNIVDFMCIKFPDISKTGMNKDGVIEEGRVDFVDIKTGKSSRLSKDQRMLQQLIKNKKINFVKMTVNTQTSETTPKTST